MKVADVAAKLDMSPATVRKLTREGIIPGLIIEGRKRRMFRYDRATIEAFLTGGNVSALPKEPTLNFDWNNNGKKTKKSQ